MGRTRSLYVCSTCAYESPRWLGRCPSCSSWNTLTEHAPTPVGGAAGAPRSAGPPPPSVRLDEVQALAEERLCTGMTEFDRVLGGGLVAGSVVLIGGEPGIGKSTLLLQALMELDAAAVPTLLVSGEESPAQVKLRERRLAAGAAAGPGDGAGGLRLLAETQVERLVGALEKERPAVCVVDSVQTLWSEASSSTPGSVAQVREVTGQLVRVAKTEGVILLLVGHVTKDGYLAGPRVLEHMVDAVLAFEGDREHAYRILRATKNRFGSTNEVGVFEMTTAGLLGVSDPSGIFREEGPPASGAAVIPAIEGSRCMLAEVQALVVRSSLAAPRRVTRGIDHNRVSMLTAVLMRRAALKLGECDIFVNTAGGLAVEDPAADVGVCLAVASSFRERALPEGVAAFGEVSLTGRVRYVSRGALRVRELAQRGFTRVLMPARTLEEVRQQGAPKGVTLDAVGDIGEALRGTIG